jgi:hypothetical protein
MIDRLYTVRALTTVALLAMLTLLPSCRGKQDEKESTATTPAGQAIYENAGAGLHLTYPTAWTRLQFGEQGTKALVAFLSPPDDNGERQHLAFDVHKLSPDQQSATAEKLKDAAIAEAKTVFPKFELISSEKTTLGGHEAYRTVYTAGTERNTGRIMQVLALANGNAYSATYTARSEAGFKRSIAQAEAIIGSARIE